MSQYLSQSELIKAIETTISKLEAGQLSLQEIEEHTQLVRELYERTLILRYKAFERYSTVETTSVIKEEVAPFVETQAASIEIIEEIKEEEEEAPFDFPQEPVPVVNTANFEFDLFGVQEVAVEEEPFEDEIGEKESTEFVVEEKHFTEHFEPAEESIQEEEEIVKEEVFVQSIQNTPVEIPSSQTSSSNQSHYLQLTEQLGRQLKSQMGYQPLSTLVGAFGLNERLLFINELFSGSSENFSDAIKNLDTRSSLEDAINLIDNLASQHNWSDTPEAVEEFLQKIYRRFA